MTQYACVTISYDIGLLGTLQARAYGGPSVHGCSPAAAPGAGLLSVTGGGFTRGGGMGATYSEQLAFVASGHACEGAGAG